MTVSAIEDKRLSLIGHILELRRRLMYSAIAVVITTALAFLRVEWIVEQLKRPAGNVELVYTQLQEMFSTYIKVALVAGVVLAMPFLVLQVILFIAPALTRKEKRFVFSILPGVMIAFASGVAFGFFVLLPPAIGFLLDFGGNMARPLITISNYISVVTTLLFWIGVCFELPVIMFFLAKLHLVGARRFSRARPVSYIVAFIIGAAVTPTSDPLNQALVAGPLIILYEFGILLARLAWRQPKEARPAKSAS